MPILSKKRFFILAAYFVTLETKLENVIDLNDILSSSYMPGSLLMLEQLPKSYQETKGTTPDVEKRNISLDGSINKALDTMKFHRSMMNQYMCRSYVADQILSEINHTKFQKRMGQAPPRSMRDKPGFAEKLKNHLLFDEGSKAYQNWLSKSATLEDIYKNHNKLENRNDGEEYLENEASEDEKKEDGLENYNIPGSGYKHKQNTGKSVRIGYKGNNNGLYFLGGGHYYPDHPGFSEHLSLGNGDHHDDHQLFDSGHAFEHEPIYGHPTKHNVQYTGGGFDKAQDLADIFEIALTALAYLSFGMFVVHLIMSISAVKNNATTTMAAMMMPMSMSPLASPTGGGNGDSGTGGGNAPGPTSIGGESTGTGSGGMPSIGSGTTTMGGGITSMEGGTTNMGGDNSSMGGGANNGGGGTTSMEGDTTSMVDATNMDGGTASMGGDTTSMDGDTTSMVDATNMDGGTASMGGDTTSMGGGSTSMGGDIIGMGGGATSIGGGTTSTGEGTTSMEGDMISMGDDTISMIGGATSEGGGTTSMGGDTTSMGGDTINMGDIPSMGGGTTSMGGDTISMGGDTINMGGATSMGGGTSSMGGDTTSIGGDTTSMGEDTISMGGGATSIGGGTSSMGGDTFSMGGGATSTGGGTTSMGGDTTSMGGDTINMGEIPSMGGGTTSMGGDTIGIGDTTSMGGGTNSMGGVTSLGGDTINVGGNTTSMAGGATETGQAATGTGVGSTDMGDGTTGSNGGGTGMDGSGSATGTGDGADTFKFRLKREVPKLNSPNNVALNEMAKKILTSIDAALVAYSDDGQCLQKSLCTSNKYSRSLSGLNKLIIPVWSLGMSWLSGNLTRDTSSKARINGLKAALLGLGMANCETIYQKCDIKKAKHLATKRK